MYNLNIKGICKILPTEFELTENGCLIFTSIIVGISIFILMYIIIMLLVYRSCMCGCGDIIILPEDLHLDEQPPIFIGDNGLFVIGWAHIRVDSNIEISQKDGLIHISNIKEE